METQLLINRLSEKWIYKKNRELPYSPTKLKAFMVFCEFTQEYIYEYTHERTNRRQRNLQKIFNFIHLVKVL